jgi:putative two-component system hydrogenase maturation factor HypX/HoxX
MRILLLTHGFNSLAQRLFAELRGDGHAVSVELDIADAVTEEAVALWQPDLVIAPFLKRRIPDSVWARVPCLVVHPGPPGDRGPAALDWAILDGAAEWGVTVLQATGDYDAGPVWAAQGFAMRTATKSSLYRHEVTGAAVQAVREAMAHGGTRVSAPVPGRFRAAPDAALRTLDWARMDGATLWRTAAAADGQPGAIDRLFGTAQRVFDLHLASAAALARAPDGPPGAVVARRGPALLRRTLDGGVWIGHLRPAMPPPDRPALKLAATRVFAEQAAALPELDVPLEHGAAEWDELRYEEFGPAHARVGWLEFELHNGALDSGQCERLRDALRRARQRDTRVLVLAGGADFFCNGIHLHDIEAAAHRSGDSAADASWRNIQAIDDVVLEILSMTDRITVAALRGNAGAGGCFVALAADRVWAHGGVVLNPHYKAMGNLYGSEYWTYTLPRRVGAEQALRITQGRLPLSARDALSAGLVDALLAADHGGFEAAARREALGLAASSGLAPDIAAKARRRAADEAERPLGAHRADELQRMHRNFYGFDPSYHVARHHFVTRKPHAWTPRHLALHRR